MTIPEDANIDCPFQRTGMGALLCRAADTSRSADCTNEVDEEVCYGCEAGKIYREIGCDQFTPKVLIYASRYMGLPKTRFVQRTENIFCKKRKRSTTFAYCQSCSLVSAPTTQKIYKETLDFFESTGFKSSRDSFEEAKGELGSGNLDGCIRASVVCLESTLKTILDKLGEPYPQKEHLTDLWKAAKDKIFLGEEMASTHLKQVIGSVTGAVSGLAGLRNDLSDAHGKGLITPEVYESYAELAMNLAATLSTFVIRKSKEVKK